MNNYIKVFYILSFFICFTPLFSQSYLTNPSLEGTPADATMPTGWFAASEMTTPDILPGYWGVYTEPADGETYIGLITRQDNTYESIFQRTTERLEKGSCYEMALHLAYSAHYSGFNSPIKLRVWISNKKNKREQMVYESPIIDNEEWEEIKINFKPTKNMKYIILEAFNDSNSPKKGNILIDNIKDLRFCNRV